MKTAEIYESPIKERNVEKYGYCQNQCECCGKPLTANAYYFHASTDWEALPLSATDSEISAAGLESQGTFNVGASCAKKFPKGYTEIYND